MVYESNILFIKLVLIAAFAGGLLGIEREMVHKAVAGTDIHAYINPWRTQRLRYRERESPRTLVVGVCQIASQTSQIFLSITLVGISHGLSA